MKFNSRKNLARSRKQGNRVVVSLGALELLGWRRKRKAAAVAA
jgi:hypothetical protein